MFNFIKNSYKINLDLLVDGFKKLGMSLVKLGSGEKILSFFRF